MTTHQVLGLVIKTLSGFFAVLLVASCAITAPTKTMIDCPLRDEAYSVDTPMMDLMLNPAVAKRLQAELPSVMQNIPSMFLDSEAPSLSAIMTLRGSADLLRMPMDEATASRLNQTLALVPVTDDDKKARCARYDNEPLESTLIDADKQILIFDKFNGYGHESTQITTDAIKTISSRLGWAVTVTHNGGAFTPETLKQFDVVVWNNVSGDVLTLSQRKAFERYINTGGGFLGIHGAGGDFMYLWDWYLNELLGAQFIGHTMNPHYQEATVNMKLSPSKIDNGLARQWSIRDEWYSFKDNPRDKGFDIIASVDENSYLPEMSGISLRMGDDHPIAWSRCVGKGRSFYSVLGHLPEVYQNEQNLLLLENALVWTASQSNTGCVK